MLAQHLSAEWKQRYMTGALDRLGEFALVFGTRTGLPARADFSLICNKTTQDFYLLIIDLA
jgi:hypothetical protein